MSAGSTFEERLKSHDPAAAEELYRYFFEPACNAAFQIVQDRGMAEDVAQEALWRVWTSAGIYDEARGPLLAWVLTITHNVAVDYLRSPAIEIAKDRPDGRGLTLEEHISVTLALERLHPIERRVLTLMFYDGLSHAEIARRVKRPLGTIKTWIRTALIHLREQLTPMNKFSSGSDYVSPSKRVGRPNLKRSEVLLRRAIEQDRNAVAISDVNAEFLLYNTAADSLLGIGTAERNLARNCSERYGLYRPDGHTPYPAHELPLWLAISGEHIFRRKVFIRNPTSPDGILVDVSAKPRRDEQGRVVGGVLTCRPTDVRQFAKPVR